MIFMEKDTIKILLIEDNPDDAVLIREMLHAVEDVSFHIQHADHLSSGLHMYDQSNFDVLLLDFNLPDSQGFDTFHAVQSHLPHIPVVILTELDNKELAIRAVHQGAQNYLIKDQMDTALLSHSIICAIGRAHAEEDIRKNEANCRNILINTADAILIMTTEDDRIIQYANPAAERLFGLPDHSLLGSRFPYPLTTDTHVEITLERPDTSYTVVGMKAVETIWEGKKAILAILRDITGKIEDQKILKRQKHDLEERMKELKCIYRIGEFIRKERTSIEDVLQKIVQTIPVGWQVPARTGCRIQYEDSVFTENFTESPWILRAPINTLYGEGVIEVSYVESGRDTEPQTSDPFLEEEQNLLSAIADQIGEFIERMKVRERLKENEKKYRTLFNSSGDAIFIHTLDGTILEVNQVAIERMGYSRDEFLKLSLSDIDSSEYAGLIPQRINQVIQETYGIFETAHITKEGKIIPIEVSGRLIEFEGHEAILSIARDISARKWTEKQLQTSYLFLEAANKHVCMNPLLEEYITLIKKLTGCEAASIRIFNDKGIIVHSGQNGFSPEQTDDDIHTCMMTHRCICSDIFKGTIDPHSPFVTDMGSFFTNNAIEELSQFTGKHENDYENECRGKICIENNHQSMALIPIPAEDRTIGILHIAHSPPDILTYETVALLEKAAMQLGTAIQRIKTAEELQRSEKTSRALLNAMTEAAFLMDLDGTIISVNEEFCRRMNISMKDAVGTYGFDLLPPDIASHRKSMVEKVISTGTPVQFEDVRDGKNTLNSIYPISDSQGKIEKLAIFGFDLTEQKKAEEKIRASLMEKEILLKEIHHRVKNNMQIISSLLNLQSRQVRDNEIIAVLRESQNRIRSMALVHEKLYQSEDFSGIDFASYVKTLVKDIIRTFGEKTAHVTIDVDIEKLCLDIDTTISCGLIINELISNAFKHAFPHKKKGKIRISLQKYNNTYELQVSDDGVGIPSPIDLSTAQSLGLRLVSILVKNQLKGTVTLDRSSGTQYRIMFGDG